MKIAILLLVALGFAINSNAQKPTTPTHTKQAEQSEIYADGQLKKQLQQKQLFEKPQVLNQSEKQEKIGEKKQTIKSKKSSHVRFKNKRKSS